LSTYTLVPWASGVWIVSNTRRGRTILNMWLAAYWDHASAHWRHDRRGRHTGQDDLGWSCSQPDVAHPGTMRPCSFGRESYEQGAFVKYVLPAPQLRKWIRLVPWQVLQNPNPNRLNRMNQSSPLASIVHHFVGPPKTKYAYLTRWLRRRNWVAHVLSRRAQVSRRNSTSPILRTSLSHAI
jgi:hypothetical protein